MSRSLGSLLVIFVFLFFSSSFFKFSSVWNSIQVRWLYRSTKQQWKKSNSRLTILHFVVSTRNVLCYLVFFFSVTVRYRFQQWLDENRDSHVTRISETLSTEDALYIRLPGTGKGTSPSGVPGFELVSFAGCIGHSERVSFCLLSYVISLPTYPLSTQDHSNISARWNSFFY